MRSEEVRLAIVNEGMGWGRGSEGTAGKYRVEAWRAGSGAGGRVAGYVACSSARRMTCAVGDKEAEPCGSREKPGKD